MKVNFRPPSSVPEIGTAVDAPDRIVTGATGVTVGALAAFTVIVPPAEEAIPQASVTLSVSVTVPGAAGAVKTGLGIVGSEKSARAHCPGIDVWQSPT